MFTHGRPRYWIDWYDRWHWLLVALLAVLIWGAWTHPASTLGLGWRGAPVPSTRRVALPAMSPSVIESPQNGSGFLKSRLGDAEGRAQVGSTVLLEYVRPDGAWMELARIPVSDTGRFRFALRNFPVGSFRLRVRAFTPDGRSEASPEVMFTVVADPTPVRSTRRRN